MMPTNIGTSKRKRDVQCATWRDEEEGERARK